MYGCIHVQRETPLRNLWRGGERVKDRGREVVREGGREGERARERERESERETIHSTYLTHSGAPANY
jgi:hypothetical protein